MNIIFRVDEILKEKNLSIREFSRIAGINYRTALDICNNQYKRIGLDTLAKICDTLDVTPADIFVYRKL